MDNEGVADHRRSVLVHTVRGTVEGQLDVSSAARTLDGLNMLHHTFVTIRNPVVASDHWSIDPSALVLNTGCILFVVERSNPATDSFSSATSSK